MPRRSLRQKREVIDWMRRTGLGPTDASKRFDIPRQTLYKWANDAGIEWEYIKGDRDNDWRLGRPPDPKRDEVTAWMQATGGSPSAAARKFGISTSNAFTWAKRVGLAGNIRRKWTEEEKENAIMILRSNPTTPLSEMAIRLDVPKPTLYTWARKAGILNDPQNKRGRKGPTSVRYRGGERWHLVQQGKPLRPGGEAVKWRTPLMTEKQADDMAESMRRQGWRTKPIEVYPEQYRVYARPSGIKDSDFAWWSRKWYRRSSGASNADRMR